MDRALKPRERRFIAAYNESFNAQQAALTAGYSSKTAQAQGYQLLKRLAGEVAAYGQALLEEINVTNRRIVREVALIAFANPADYTDKDGKLIPIEQLGELARAIKEIDVKVDSRTGLETTKYKFYSKQEALEFLGKAGGMLNDIRPPALLVNFNIMGGTVDEPPRVIEVGNG